ncbi:hypothetical protein AVEN_40378-1 [Araneus ventricosus]|uniref:BEN domain-containing protein n=1 Tax=Araneus ventricosus TaxID=182803 RepID=A0A4Y2IQ47_ARAVE|nr:hypothetical protein AVEN_40378-1 [Araneus ventricosus]
MSKRRGTINATNSLQETGSSLQMVNKKKCRASFELFCQQLVANNAFDLPYKIAAGKIRKQTVLQSVKTSNGQFTNTIEETIQTIVQALFPTDDSTQETHVQRKKRETFKYLL